MTAEPTRRSVPGDASSREAPPEIEWRDPLVERVHVRLAAAPVVAKPVPRFDAREFASAFAGQTWVRAIVVTLQLARDAVAGTLGLGVSAMRRLHGAQVRFSDHQESYSQRFRRWTGGIVTVYLLEAAADGKRDRSARSIYAVDLAEELTTHAYGQPAVVVDRFGRVTVRRKSEELTDVGRLRIRLVRRPFGDLFRVEDLTGNRLTLAPGVLLLLLALHGAGEVSLAQLVVKAIRRGENAVLLAQINDDLLSEAHVRRADERG